MDRDPLEDGAAPGCWPQWRGRNGSGVASAGSPAIRFSHAEGYRWKSPVPGRGNSSPVVWNDAVLLTTATDASDPPTLSLLCFDRADGRLRWQSEVGRAHGRTHVKNGYASASATTDGERIFTYFGGTGLFCHDFSGKQLWRADLGPIDHLWGVASSPVLFGSTVIQLCDYDGDSYIAAFDKATGRQVWRTPRVSGGSWSTPVLVEADAGGQPRTEMIVQGGSGTGGRKVIAYDPADGRELWRAGDTTDLVTPTPLVCNGLVYCISGRNGPIMAIRPGGGGDVTSSRVVWQTSRGGPYIPSGVCYRNRLYVLTDIGALTCYDPGDGREIWQTRLTGPFTSSLIAADGRLYAVNERGTVFVVAADDSFRLLAKNDMQSPCLATPAVVNGELLIRTESDLYCIAGTKSAVDVSPIDRESPFSREPPASGVARGRANSEGEMQNAKRKMQNAESPATDHRPLTTNDWPLFRGDPQATGVAHGELPAKLELLWTFSTDQGGFEATAAIVDGTVYIGDVDKTLYALNLANGEKRWEFTASSGFTASAAARNARVYVSDTDGRFHCIDAATGTEKWHFDADGQIDSSANFHGDHVLFGSQDTHLYCLDAVSGELVWKYESPDQIRSFPTVLADQGFIAGCDGQLHVIDLVQGKEVNSVDLLSPTTCAPAIMDETVFIGTESHRFFAVDPREPKILWRFSNADHGVAFRSSAAVTPEAVMVGSRDKQVHAFNPKTGKPLWSFSTKGRVDSSPVVVGQRVFVGSSDGRLYAIDVKTGEAVWQFEAGGELLASPAVAEGRLVIGNDSGSLYCFGAK